MGYQIDVGEVRAEDDGLEGSRSCNVPDLLHHGHVVIRIQTWTALFKQKQWSSMIDQEMCQDN